MATELTAADPYTLVVTACGRPELLDITLRSFVEHCIETPKRIVIVEDSGRPGINDRVKRAWNNPFYDIVWLDTNGGRNQLKAIDLAYSHVETPWFFHCEEDWKFMRPGFIQVSKTIMLEEPMLVTIQLRGDSFARRRSRIQGDTIATPGGTVYEYRRLLTHWNRIWHGFTFNPGLRRLADYKKVGPMAQIEFNRVHPRRSEAAVGQLYFNAGYRVAYIVGEPWMIHTGYGKHVGEDDDQGN